MSQIPLNDDSTRPPFHGPKLLERALAVVRFAPVVKLTVDTSVIAELQDRFRTDFPLFERKSEGGVQIELQANGEVSQSAFEEQSLVFTTADRQAKAVVSSNFLALDVTQHGYSSWPWFIDTMRTLLRHLVDLAEPALVQRLGVRYLNTGPAEGEADPRNFCTRDLISVSGVEGLRAADLLWQFNVSEGHLVLRNGVMPPNSSYDPSFFAGRDASAWYLDIDVFSADQEPFDVDKMSESLFAQAKRLHAIYYWAMTREEKQ